MLIGSVIDDEFGDDPHVAAMGLRQKLAKIVELAVNGMNVAVIGNVVAVVF